MGNDHKENMNDFEGPDTQDHRNSPTLMPPPVSPARLVFEGPKGPLFKALAESRKSYKHLATSGKVQFGEGSKARKHEYAPLDVVIDALEPGWEAAGLCVMQPHDGDSLWTIVAVGDSSMSIEQPLSEWKSAQDLGSILTYFRRYHLKGVFCVADSEDDDGATAPGGQGVPLGRKEPTAPKATGKVGAPLAASVTAEAKAKGLSGEQFAKLVYGATGNAWKDCTDADADKVLAELKGL